MPAARQPAARSRPQPESAPAPAGEVVADAWTELAERLPISGMARQLALHSALVEQNDQGFALLLEASFGHVLNERWVKVLEQGVSEAVGSKQRIRIELADAGRALNTPARLEKQRAAQRQREAEAVIADDPLVCALIEAFDARILPEHTRPNQGKDER